MSYIIQHGRLIKVSKRVRGNLYASHPVTRSPNTIPEFPADKGRFMGSCNRSACLAPGANWYNHGSLAYYCESCAHMLNSDRFNKADAMESFSHDLCTEGKHHEG